MCHFVSGTRAKSGYHVPVEPRENISLRILKLFELPTKEIGIKVKYVYEVADASCPTRSTSVVTRFDWHVS